MTLSKKQQGFTLVEMLVGSVVFAIIAVSVFQTYSGYIRLVAAGKYKIMAADIIDEQFELVRNLAYKDVGIIGSIPSGVLSTTTSVTRNGSTFIITRTIRNIDDPFDGTLGGVPNDLSPADSKLVQVEIACPGCKNFTPVSASTRVGPKNLETASNNGALFIKVFDANGQPVPQANVNATYVGTTSSIVINDQTNNQGVLQIVDAPPGIASYRITVTKSGFTTDRTYATSSSNPNPVKPDATVINQNVTESSFIIDKSSQATIQTTNKICTSIPSVGFNMQGGKLIGASPNVLKFDNTYSTDISGQKMISNLEWDTFNIAITSAGWYLAGTNPILPISILPNSSQTINLVLTNDAPAHILAIITDSATDLPVSGATINLTQGPSLIDSKESGRGYLEQTDWSGGEGQQDYIDQTHFWSTDDNIAISSPAGDAKLITSLGSYVPSGEITSSVFDTGSPSNFGNIFWSPTAEPPQAGSQPIKFQIASANDDTSTTTWNYLGPDGTNSTFYTVSNTNISSVHNGNRYFRYKMLLSTADSAYTPTLANVAFTFTSDCIPPGQAFFSGLSSGSYNLDISKTGYTSQSIPINVNSNWQKQNVSLAPE